MGGHEKLIYRRELPKKGEGLGQFADLRRTWQKRGVVGFEGVGGETPMHTMNLAINLTVTLIY